jgi:hypothetical protein
VWTSTTPRIEESSTYAKTPENPPQRNSKIEADFIASSVQENFLSVFSIASSEQENFFSVFSIASSVQENFLSVFSIAS